MQRLIRKFAEDLSSTIAVPVDPPPNTPAPISKGPHNNKQLQPFQNQSRVNTAIPPVNAGANEQKALPPMKVAQVSSEVAKMATFGTRPLIQDLVKQAMENAVDRARLSSEHANLQKLASQGETEKEEEREEKKKEHKKEGSVSTEYAMKLAAAVEYIVKQASTAPAPHMTEKAIGPGTGPNALQVLTPKDHPPVAQPGQSGHSPAHSVPMHTPEQKGLPQEHGATQAQNTLGKAPGGGGHQELSISGGKGKVASVKDRLMKLAEDAINPAQISAGAAVPPDTNAAGESGGAPVGGAPQGPTGLVASNEAAINYKKDQAYANRKSDLAAYLTEKPLSAATDPVLQKALEHTGEAGVKISHALETPVQVAAARALLTKIAEEAKKEEKKDEKKDKKESKEKDSNAYC